MSGPVNSVLGYLAARSRGDASVGAPGETDTAPSLRPRPPPAQATGDADNSPFGFVEESLEIERKAPRGRRSASDAEPEITLDRPTQAVAPTDGTTQAISRSHATSTPAQAPPSAPVSTAAAAAAAAPIPAAPRPAAAPAPATSDEARTPVKTQDVSPAPLSPPRPNDRTAMEVREAQTPPAARTVTATLPADPLGPPPVLVRQEAAAGVAPPPVEPLAPLRAAPPAERVTERLTDHATERPRLARETALPPPAAPQVQITIGRVEIRAASPPPPPPARGPMMSLEDYLARRAGG